MSQTKVQKTIVSGVLLLDKPAAISSHDALFATKKLLMSPCHDSKKAGHTGTLDPMATGLLPLCFGEATKFAQFGLDAHKGYDATIRLGLQTDTGDADGQAIDYQAVPNFGQADLDKIACQFVGKIWQLPPMYSALKKDGKKLYEYARAGVQVDRVARAIEILRLKLTKLDEKTIALSVVCSKGTYVRVLGEDIAKALGTVGHLTTLRRISTGGYQLADAISLDELRCLEHNQRLKRLLPMDTLLDYLPKVIITTDESERLQQGQRLNLKERMADVFRTTDQASTLLRLYCDQVFVGLGELAITGRLQPKKMLQTTLKEKH